MAAVLKNETPQTSHPDDDALQRDFASRELTDTQRAIAGARLVEGFPRGKGERNTERAARIVGASVAQINRVRRIMRHDPALLARVEANELSINAAAVKVMDEPSLSTSASVRAAHIAELAAQGGSSLVIGEAIGLSPGRVWQIAKRFGIPLAPARKNTPFEERIDQISALAKGGNRSEQIAAKLGLSDQHVRRLARRHKIALPNAVIGNVHKIKTRRIVESMVHALAGEVVAIDALKAEPFPDYDDIERKQLADSLARSLKGLQWLLTQLRGDR